MPTKPPTFREWLPATYETMSVNYRNHLRWVIDTVTSYCENMKPTAETVQVGISCLPPCPVIDRYPGEVSLTDREWYATQLKPDFARMRAEAVEEIKAILND